MLFQNDPNEIKNWEATKLSELPSNENNIYEYKSSRIDNNGLKKVLLKAASGFWNSGGGLLVIGVNDNGEPDGGIEDYVGNTSRRDWIDQILLDVEPQGNYAINKINNANLNIEEEKAIYLIAFGKSQRGPHMASDNKYYMRAGAHTVPAPHFIVEAIYARRNLSLPLLRPTFRLKPQNSNVIQLGIIALNDAPAFEVKIDFDSIPPIYEEIKNPDEELLPPLEVGVINKKNPVYIDYGLVYRERSIEKSIICKLEYKDLTGDKKEDEFDLEVSDEIASVRAGRPSIEKIEKHLSKIEGYMKKIKNK